MINYKSIDVMDSVMDVDTEKRIVKAVWSRLGNIDLDMDIMAAGCYNKTIAERGPMGKNQVWSLVDHNPSIKSALGKPMELYIEGDMLIAVTKIVDTEIGEDAIKLYNAGCINEHSVGFRTIKSDMNNETGIRTINEVMLYEGSAVIWGANPETPTLGMKSLLSDNPEDLVKRLEKLTVAFKNGTFTDDTFGLLEIQIKQIQDSILKLSTPPAAKAVEPQKEDTTVLDAIKQTNSQLKNLLK
jgi:HK97 family phage prohead protease